VKFRQIDKATLARLQTRDEADENPNAELEEEESDDEESEEPITTMSQHNNGNHGGRTAFLVDPNMDLNSTALLDMISPDPIVSEQITATQQDSTPVNELERRISVAEAFESHSW
jgi:hypothetical protein